MSGECQTKNELIECLGLMDDYAAVMEKAVSEIKKLQDKLKNQCTECPLNRRYDDSERPALLRRQTD